MKVKSVTKIKLDESVPVYDLSVPETETFCLGNGVVTHNSKDVSDALAGVCYGLTMRREIWVKYGIPLMTIPTHLKDKANTTKNSVDRAQQEA